MSTAAGAGGNSARAPLRERGPQPPGTLIGDGYGSTAPDRADSGVDEVATTHTRRANRLVVDNFGSSETTQTGTSPLLTRLSGSLTMRAASRRARRQHHRRDRGGISVAVSRCRGGSRLLHRGLCLARAHSHTHTHTHTPAYAESRSPSIAVVSGCAVALGEMCVAIPRTGAAAAAEERAGAPEFAAAATAGGLAELVAGSSS